MRPIPWAVAPRARDGSSDGCKPGNPGSLRGTEVWRSSAWPSSVKEILRLPVRFNATATHCAEQVQNGNERMTNSCVRLLTGCRPAINHRFMRTRTSVGCGIFESGVIPVGQQSTGGVLPAQQRPRRTSLCQVRLTVIKPALSVSKRHISSAACGRARVYYHLPYCNRLLPARRLQVLASFPPTAPYVCLTPP